MKRLQNILHTVHGWPEEARQLLAMAVMIVAAVAVFSGWSSIVSSSLTPLSGTVVAVSPPAGNAAPSLAHIPPQLPADTGGARTVLSPLGGIVESLKGLATLVAKFPSPRESVESAASALGAFDLTGGVNQALDAIGQFLYERTK